MLIIVVGASGPAAAMIGVGAVGGGIAVALLFYCGVDHNVLDIVWRCASDCDAYCLRGNTAAKPRNTQQCNNKQQ